MPDLLIDSDAFLCVRGLSLLTMLVGRSTPFSMADYARRHELSSIDLELSALEARHVLTVRVVLARTPEHATFRRLTKTGTHKGEAEAIAWAISNAPDAVFVSHDAGARRTAAAERIFAVDVLGLAVLLVANHGFPEVEVREKLAPWEDNRHSFGCPNDWKGIQQSWAERKHQLGL
jgi:hypothetical protein